MHWSEQACELVNKYMAELASQWVYVKFVRLPASLCGVNVPANKLPILSVYRYRGGELTWLRGRGCKSLPDATCPFSNNGGIASASVTNCPVSVVCECLSLSCRLLRGGELVTVIRNLKEELMSGGRDTFSREDLEWCVLALLSPLCSAPLSA